MQKSLILAAVCLTFVGMALASGRIMGGEEAGLNDTPYAGSLRVDNAHVCGACILSETKLLTTAHCLHRDGKVIDPSRLSVRVGTTNQYASGKIAYVASTVIHPNYYGTKYNLAVVELSSPLVFTERIKAISLATAEDELPAVGSEIIVAGWGRTVDGTNSYKIRELSLKVAADEACTDAYSEYDNSSFCLAHELKEGTCHGDGGAGAVYNDKLIGLTNFVVGACGSRYPDIFVRVSAFADWIQEQLV